MSKKTGKAAVFTGPGKSLEIRSYPVSTPEPGQALLEMRRSGICGTDLHILSGRLPLPIGEMILGHEFLGVVKATGVARTRDGLGNLLRAGDLAIACVAMPCGKCFNCRKGETASCLSFGVTYFRNPAEPPHFFGGYAEYLYSPCSNLVKVPLSVDLDAAAAFACAGPTVIRAFDFAAAPEKGDLVVVQGAGPVGLFATAWAVKAGAEVMVVGSGSNPARMRLARALGARQVIDYRKTSPAERAVAVRKRAKRMGRGDGADVVFEATGSPAAVPEGLDMVRTLGCYVIPGQYSASGPVEIQPQTITFKAIRIVGSAQYKLSDIRTYLDFLKKHPALGRVFAKCVTHKYRISEAARAMANADKGRSIKGVFAS